MKIRSVSYLTKEGVKNLWANRLMTAASVGVLMACMVLIGYDNTRNTVTLSDPAGGIITVSMDLFELRYAQMGAQAIMVK